MEVRLRPMCPADVDVIVPLEQELFAGDPPWNARQFHEELTGVPETRWYLVAEADDENARIVGYAGLLAPSAPGEPADIQTIAVAPAYQRQGVGDRLMDALLAEARRRDAGSVLLEVRVDNQAARAFYQRRGFERIAVRRNYYGSGRDGLVLRKRLAGRP